jgi:hypothetical protein
MDSGFFWMPAENTGMEKNFHGVQVVGGSNPLAPTKDQNPHSRKAVRVFSLVPTFYAPLAGCSMSTHAPRVGDV